jgi:hypothetical protein
LRRRGEPSTTQHWITEPWPLRRRFLLLLLVLAFVRGLVYLAVFPPWQHYDEPTHFEYVRLIAERRRLPGPDDYELAMRQEIAASMQAADFWKGMQVPTIQFWSDQPPSIGVSELQHPPLYYALEALPQLLVMYQDVETQLYLARLGSVLLYVLVVASAYGLLQELWPRRRWLPVSVAAFVALLPPFTDLMSAVNNDVGATAAVSLLLWAAVRLVRRGPSPGRVAIVLLLAGACVATKSTAGAIAMAVLLSLGIGYLPPAWRRRSLGVLALFSPVLLIVAFTWGGQAAYWSSDPQPSVPNRVEDQAFAGHAAFALSAAGTPYPQTIFQELERTAGRTLRGHTVTFGAWIKAPAGSEGTVGLRLDDNWGGAWHQVQATTDWQFQAFTATIRIDISGLAAYAFMPNRADAAQEVYIDGLILVDGEMPVKEAPQFETAQAAAATWGGRKVTNLLNNGSAEQVWPGLRSWIGDRYMYRTPVSQIFYSFWDVRRTAWVYPHELSILLQSFWGRFGWNHLALPTTYFYLLGAITVLAIGGGSVGLIRRLRSAGGIERWQGQAWSMMAVTLLVAWGAAILRIHPVFITRYLFWPVARYAAVAIVPTATLVCLGLAQIVPRRWHRGAAWLGLLGLLALDTIAWWTVILPYYYG